MFAEENQSFCLIVLRFVRCNSCDSGTQVGAKSVFLCDKKCLIVLDCFFIAKHIAPIELHHEGENCIRVLKQNKTAVFG